MISKTEKHGAWRTGMILALFGTVAVCLAADEPAQPIPKWQLPPIARPYYIVWNGAASPSRSGFQQMASFSTQTMDTNATDVEWWWGRRIWAFGWSWGTQGGGGLDSVKKFCEYIVSRCPRWNGGICLDEWVGYDAESRRITGGKPSMEDRAGNPYNAMAAEACRRVKQSHPNSFIVAYTHMRSDALVTALRRGWVDLAIIESYWDLIGRDTSLERCRRAKRVGVLEKTIPCVWVGEAAKGFSVGDVAEQLETYRRLFPQMPGVCFYKGWPRSIEPLQRNLVRACDRLVHKYYIEPAPKVEVVSPRDGEMTPASFRLQVQADKPVARWRLYIGAELVSRKLGGGGQQMEFQVPILPAGPHILTVHAITADWLRGVQQIEVEVPGAPKPPIPT